MSKLSKVTVCGLICCLILIVAACSSQSNEKSNNTATPSASGSESSTPEASPTASLSNAPSSDNPVTLSAFAVQYPQVADLKDNWFTEHIAETQFIHIDWVVSPIDGANERKQLTLASGDYPEIFLEGDLTKEEQMKYGQQGVFLPLNDLIESYAPNIVKAMEDIPYLKAAMTTPDGNIYAIPKVAECYHCFYGEKMWINTEWLDNLSLDMPTTTEEFYQVLKAFKEKDPNRNSKKDEIPLSGAINTSYATPDHFLMNAFIYHDGTYLVMKDGKVDVVANKQEWKEGLAYLNKLFSEGLMDPATYTQNLEGLAMLGRSPDVAVLGATGGLHLGMFTDNTTDRWKQIRAVTPLKGPNGVQLTGEFKGVGNAVFAITNKAKNPEAAIRLADYLYSYEGTLLGANGPEDTLWRKAAAGEKDVRGRDAKWADNSAAFVAGTAAQSYHWGGMGPRLSSLEFVESRVAPEDIYSIPGYAKRLFTVTKEQYEPYAPPANTVYPADVYMSTENLEELSLIKPLIMDYIQSNMVQFITGQKSLEKDWDEYTKGLEGLKLERYLQILQEAYDSNK